MKIATRTNLKPTFRALASSDGAVELTVYDEIGLDPWTGEGITAKSFKEQIEGAGTFNQIRMRISSPGGDAFEGMTIGNYLKSLGKPIAVFVDGVAASAASIIAMCGDTITMANNAMIMIHKAHSLCMGNDSDMDLMSNALKKVDASIAQTYVDKTGLPMEEVAAMMAAETWMGAQEAVDKGFATSIAGASNDGVMAMARKFKAMDRYKHVPAALKPINQAECQCSCNSCKSGRCADCSDTDCADPNCQDCGSLALDNMSLMRAQLWLMERAV